MRRLVFTTVVIFCAVMTFAQIPKRIKDRQFISTDTAQVKESLELKHAAAGDSGKALYVKDSQGRIGLTTFSSLGGDSIWVDTGPTISPRTASDVVDVDTARFKVLNGVFDMHLSGAANDSSADCSSLFTAALASGAHTVYFPKGKYRFDSSNFTLPKSKRLLGDGYNLTQIYVGVARAGSVIPFLNLSDSTTIEAVSIRATNTDLGVDLIRLNAVKAVVGRDCYFSKVADSSGRAVGSADSKSYWYNCIIENWNNNGGIIVHPSGFVAGVGGVGKDSAYFYDCELRSGQYSYSSPRYSYAELIGCRFSQIRTTGGSAIALHSNSRAVISGGIVLKANVVVATAPAIGPCSFVLTNLYANCQSLTYLGEVANYADEAKIAHVYVNVDTIGESSVILGFNANAYVDISDVTIKYNGGGSRVGLFVDAKDTSIINLSDERFIN